MFTVALSYILYDTTKLRIIKSIKEQLIHLKIAKI